MIRHTDLLPEMPDTWRCLICRGPERIADGTQCERCGGCLHWDCYWPAMLTDTERTQFAAAQAADAAADTVAVGVWFGGQFFAFDILRGPSAVEAYSERHTILCPGCRS